MPPSRQTLSWQAAASVATSQLALHFDASTPFAVSMQHLAPAKQSFGSSHSSSV
jgi:hypothetical protein